MCARVHSELSTPSSGEDRKRRAENDTCSYRHQQNKFHVSLRTEARICRGFRSYFQSLSKHEAVKMREIIAYSGGNGCFLSAEVLEFFTEGKNKHFV